MTEVLLRLAFRDRNVMCWCHQPLLYSEPGSARIRNRRREPEIPASASNSLGWDPVHEADDTVRTPRRHPVAAPPKGRPPNRCRSMPPPGCPLGGQCKRAGGADHPALQLTIDGLLSPANLQQPPQVVPWRLRVRDKPEDRRGELDLCLQQGLARCERGIGCARRRSSVRCPVPLTPSRIVPRIFFDHGFGRAHFLLPNVQLPDHPLSMLPGVIVFGVQCKDPLQKYKFPLLLFAGRASEALSPMPPHLGGFFPLVEFKLDIHAELEQAFSSKSPDRVTGVVVRKNVSGQPKSASADFAGVKHGVQVSLEFRVGLPVRDGDHAMRTVVLDLRDHILPF
eukprot:scaffold950_cov360-Pavlova_lutheri.AAC.6